METSTFTTTNKKEYNDACVALNCFGFKVVESGITEGATPQGKLIKNLYYIKYIKEVQF